ncbi:hypothetical protein CANARDRAFT_176794 [[Candida] arabinofermentans NRRL YB-2248]|uniref:Deacetylase sirtuin-type domain-containing protein n=1 Tax=[Candida] arabinofermentans NRRL YB-2248 TaxID=983967 RepID=A0A1E4SYK4_9ASCO|nr:hypothetical protein CANARDRAFT_176794 [[Candida] arabinofermentans NRRL YB-2248]
MIPPQHLESFHDFLRSSNCKTILALIGAGLSVSSGLPTFRGSGGDWKNYTSIDLATPDAFDRDPGLVWQFYSYRRHMALNAMPNTGHYTISKLSLLNKINFLSITQNIDGLSQRSGHDPDKLLEFHGSLFSVKCTNFICSYKINNNFDDPITKKLEFSLKDFINPNNDGSYTPPIPNIDESWLPHCPDCEEGLLRPGIVWFGESLPLQLIDRADEFMIQNKKVDLILVIGTSRSVWPASSYVEMVKEQGGNIAIFNTEFDNDLENDGSCWQFIGDCADTLPIALEPLIGSLS